MGTLFRRLRGLIGVGVTWGAMWAGIGAGIGVIIGIVNPDAWRFTNPILEWACMGRCRALALACCSR